MKWITIYEDFENHHLDQTFWEVTKQDQTLRVTLGDVLDTLDGGYQIDPRDIDHLLIRSVRDPKRISRADLSYPIILLKKGGEIISILDGHHRVVKALEVGEKIRCRILDLDFSDEKFKKVFDR